MLAIITNSCGHFVTSSFTDFLWNDLGLSTTTREQSQITYLSNLHSSIPSASSVVQVHQRVYCNYYEYSSNINSTHTHTRTHTHLHYLNLVSSTSATHQMWVIFFSFQTLQSRWQIAFNGSDRTGAKAARIPVYAVQIVISHHRLSIERVFVFPTPFPSSV